MSGKILEILYKATATISILLIIPFLVFNIKREYNKRKDFKNQVKIIVEEVEDGLY